MQSSNVEQKKENTENLNILFFAIIKQLSRSHLYSYSRLQRRWILSLMEKSRTVARRKLKKNQRCFLHTLLFSCFLCPVVAIKFKTFYIKLVVVKLF